MPHLKDLLPTNDMPLLQVFENGRAFAHGRWAELSEGKKHYQLNEFLKTGIFVWEKAHVDAVYQIYFDQQGAVLPKDSAFSKGMTFGFYEAILGYKKVIEKAEEDAKASLLKKIWDTVHN